MTFHPTFRDVGRENASPMSNLEIELLGLLNNRGFFPMTDIEIPLVSTTPDFLFLDERAAFYLDGDITHKNREQKDNELREMLRKRKNFKVFSYEYHAPASKSRRLEILNDIIDNVMGLRRLHQ